MSRGGPRALVEGLSARQHEERVIAGRASAAKRRKVRLVAPEQANAPTPPSFSVGDTVLHRDGRIGQVHQPPSSTGDLGVRFPRNSGSGTYVAQVPASDVTHYDVVPGPGEIKGADPFSPESDGDRRMRAHDPGPNPDRRKYGTITRGGEKLDVAKAPIKKVRGSVIRYQVGNPEDGRWEYGWVLDRKGKQLRVIPLSRTGGRRGSVDQIHVDSVLEAKTIPEGERKKKLGVRVLSNAPKHLKADVRAVRAGGTPKGKLVAVKKVPRSRSGAAGSERGSTYTSEFLNSLTAGDPIRFDSGAGLPQTVARTPGQAPEPVKVRYDKKPRQRRGIVIGPHDAEHLHVYDPDTGRHQLVHHSRVTSAVRSQKDPLEHEAVMRNAWVDAREQGTTSKRPSAILPGKFEIRKATPLDREFLDRTRVAYEAARENAKNVNRFSDPVPTPYDVGIRTDRGRLVSNVPAGPPDSDTEFWHNRVPGISELSDARHLRVGDEVQYRRPDGSTRRGIVTEQHGARKRKLTIWDPREVVRRGASTARGSEVEIAHGDVTHVHHETRSVRRATLRDRTRNMNPARRRELVARANEDAGEHRRLVTVGGEPGWFRSSSFKRDGGDAWPAAPGESKHDPEELASGPRAAEENLSGPDYTEWKRRYRYAIGGEVPYETVTNARGELDAPMQEAHTRQSKRGRAVVVRDYKRKGGRAARGGPRSEMARHPTPLTRKELERQTQKVASMLIRAKQHSGDRKAIVKRLRRLRQLQAMSHLMRTSLRETWTAEDRVKAAAARHQKLAALYPHLSDPVTGARLTNVRAGLNNGESPHIQRRTFISADVEQGGEKVGSISRIFDHDSNTLVRERTSIDDAHQRQGIASGLAQAEETMHRAMGTQGIEVVPLGDGGQKLTAGQGGFKQLRGARVRKELREDWGAYDAARPKKGRRLRLVKPIRTTFKPEHVVGMHPATPEDRKRLRIPAAYKDVHVPDDPTHHVAYMGIDAVGRKQTRYTANHDSAQAVAKFARVKAFAKLMPHIDAEIQKGVAQNDPTAAALMLVRRMGLRPGSTNDTKAKVQAYGASTLQARHITLSDDGHVHLQFIGKKGVPIDIGQHDPELADALRPHLEGKSGTDAVFDTSAAKMNARLKQIVGGQKFSVKDFRTHLATSHAATMVESMPVPRNKREHQRARNAIGDEVASRLGNNRAQALESYIAPEVFGPWDHVLEPEAEAKAA